MGFRHAVAVTFTALAPLVQAQDASDWKGEAELGVLVTSGNSEETNINGRLALRVRLRIHRHYRLWPPGLGIRGTLLPGPLGRCRLSLQPAERARPGR